jgi:hypothetical protein
LIMALKKFKLATASIINVLPGAKSEVGKAI